MNYSNKIVKFVFLLSLIMFLTGLVASKALISIGSVGIFMSGIVSYWVFKNPRSLQLSLLTGYGLLALMPLISGIWSENTQAWLDSIANKIMLPFLAIGMLWSPALNRREVHFLILFQISTVLAASLYSIGAYLYLPFDINKTYLTAKTLPVLLNNDHLHFSLYVFITIVLIYNYRHLFYDPVYRILRFVLFGAGAWFVIYLHILGAKTGLIFLYLGVAIIFFSNDFIKTNKYKKWLIIPALVVAFSIAYKFIPSFYNRFHYTRYDFNQYIHGEYVNGLTDGARVLSWKAGIEIANINPLLGVGFGDMHYTFTKWHETNSAHLERYNWLQPSNEWLMYVCGAGLLGMLTLSLGLWMIYLKSSYVKSLPYYILFLSQALMMWYEVNLNNQIGISLFVFSLCSFALFDFSKSPKLT